MIDLQDTEQLLEYISSAPKSTPSVFFLKLNRRLDFPDCDVFGAGDCVVFGDFYSIERVLKENAEAVAKRRCFAFARNSGVPLADKENFNARIEPAAIVREGVKIGQHAVVMMGAVINIGAEIGERTMIDMNAVVGARARIGENCHIGAGAVVAGVLEPPSAKPVVVGNNVTVGANAVLLEGVAVGNGAVVAAGAVVTADVPPDCVAAGCPAKIVKRADGKTRLKTMTVQGLRG